MAPSPALRNQWTVKSKRIDQELVTGCRLAAERQGMAMSDWCVETLREAARVTLTGPGAASPPARLEDVADVLSARGWPWPSNGWRRRWSAWYTRRVYRPARPGGCGWRCGGASAWMPCGDRCASGSLFKRVTKSPAY